MTLSRISIRLWLPRAKSDPYHLTPSSIKGEGERILPLAQINSNLTLLQRVESSGQRTSLSANPSPISRLRTRQVCRQGSPVQAGAPFHLQSKLQKNATLFPPHRLLVMLQWLYALKIAFIHLQP